MPGFDGTGPAGQGPMTGKAMGSCGYGCPYASRGRRFGFRQSWVSPKNNLRDLEDEKTRLEQDLSILQVEIETIKKEVQKQ